MKYRQKSDQVEAFRITQIDPADENGYCLLHLDGGDKYAASRDMRSHIHLCCGDYLVRLPTGIAYLLPYYTFDKHHTAALGDRIEPAVADDPGDVQQDTLRERVFTATRYGASLGPQVAKAEGNPIQARYTLAVEITKAERRAEHLRTLLNALPRSFWERPGAEETIREVLGK